jgi:curved DNA-binding protein CbpA
MARSDQAEVEHVDLDPEKRREILRLEEGLDRMNHFEVLGLPPGASPAEVKQSYYDASLKYHPDRFYQKKLGSFETRIERIFKRLTEAYMVLTDPQKRRDYERAHPELLRAPKPTPKADDYRPADPVRGAERRKRLAKHPYLSRHAGIGELVEQARKHHSVGEYDRALGEPKVASRAEPDDRDLRQQVEETRAQKFSERSTQEIKRAESAEENGDLDMAAGCYRAASDLDPKNASAAANAARLLKSTGKHLPLARELSERAVALEPRNPHYRCLLGEILADSGMRKQAKVQFEEAAKISPENPRVKNGLKKVRWLF